MAGTESHRGWRHPDYKIRATAFAQHDNRVLVHCDGDDPKWWALPGGGPDFGELTHDTVRREMLEELNCNVQVHELLWLIERVFVSRATGRKSHHVDFIYRTDVIDVEVLGRREPWTVKEEGYGVMTFHWLPLHALHQPPHLVPPALRAALTEPHPGHPVHLLIDDL